MKRSTIGWTVPMRAAEWIIPPPCHPTKQQIQAVQKCVNIFGQTQDRSSLRM